MRYHTLLVPAIVLGTAGPALGDEGGGSGGYYAGWVCGTGCLLTICVGIPLWFLRGFLQEHARGQKRGLTDEERSLAWAVGAGLPVPAESA